MPSMSTKVIHVTPGELSMSLCKGYRPEARGYVIYSPRALPEGCALGQRTRGINHVTTSWMPINGLFLHLRGFLKGCRNTLKKNYAGGLKHRKLRPKTVEQHDNPGNPERCIVRIFEKYQSRCPKLKPGSPLYLTPKRKVSSDDVVWYTKTPVRKNTLRKVVQDMCRVAGIEGYKTNHSLRLRATTCTIGLEKGVPEKLIMERTGHRTVKSLHTYQRVSDGQKEIVSDVLQGSATDFSGTSVESDEPPTKKICECAPKENTAQFINARGLCISMQGG